MAQTSKKLILGKILYGSIFVIVLPIFLVFWAYYTKNAIQLPVPQNQLFNGITIAIGAIVIISGMFSLWHFGKGLPMNAFPPKHYVTKGAYTFCKNPIYLGAIILSFGISAFLHSSSGFWLISPMLLIMTFAYNVGFENERTEKNFGKQNFKPFLSLPANSDMLLSNKERISALFLAYVPWVLMYEAFIFLGIPKNAIPTNTVIDTAIPFIESSVIFYISIYLYAFLIPFVLKTKKQLHSLIIDILMATGISALLYFSFPFIVLQKNFVPDSLLGKILILDRSYDGTSAAFPAFHVIWAFIAARYFSIRFTNTKWIWYSLSVLISISCLTTGNHSIFDVAAGIIVYILTLYRTAVWNSIRSASEFIANSWSEWHIGSVRIINHGFYAGAAAIVGTLIISSLLGEGNSFGAFIIGVFAIIGAALWAQIIEGSPRLQRPYGYYGSVVGALIGSLIMVLLFNANLMILLASVAMAAPWVQMIGRLRCLVQGCCHGKPSDEWLGIKFIQPYSRVNKISGLKGICLHPTQLYSIGSNFITGILLIRLYKLGMSASFITGIYLLLNALGRFVEEYFRGEAQTPYWLGMRIYQWIAVFFVIVGIIFTSLPSKVLLDFNLTLSSIFWAIIMGFISTFAFGIDFPNSNKRFARLTSH